MKTRRIKFQYKYSRKKITFVIICIKFHRKWDAFSNTFRPIEEGKVNTQFCYLNSGEYSADTHYDILLIKPNYFCGVFRARLNIGKTNRFYSLISIGT
jgi:hypothetical protein